MKHEKNKGAAAFSMIAGAVSAALLLSACVSNQPQGGTAGLPSNAQLVGGVAQAMVNGQSASAAATQMAVGAATPQATKLPAKMSCKEVTSRLIKTRADMVSISNKPVAPVIGDNKLAMAGGMASLAGSLTGNAQLAQVGNQVGAVTGSGAAAGQNIELANLDAQRTELEARGASMKCKLPAAPVATMLTPAAPVLSCAQLKQEWKTINTPALPSNNLTDKAQTVGMFASVAGSLTGNETLKTVGNQANAVAGSGTPAADLVTRRATLEAQAKAQRCKL
jgi:hypothetical protein